ncbi:LOW QUALITY PROTEIN: disintegrin and metalloproteinase domain-containing protein 9-like [Tyto alba]|uniref:LOW QUALITY PROTEIN: disintegrin and metalloproteinase domain-containing protein 9-like n=1 Tax=Tyto alba TaxID=56313 RepID=UPI001C67751A|nr:LOW QUALITY PROTEIN: disintegrin and metalloproteinase domain-containing protein 9-like [Tyto alba]
MAPSQAQLRCTPTDRGVLLLGLGLSFLLQGLLLPCTDCGPQPSWGYAAYEIVIPRKLGPEAGKGSQGEVSYIINIQGVNYAIHLRQKDFVIKNFPVFTRDSQGEIMAKQPHVPADCYYHGYVEGILDSAVTLTTCSGLRGLLQIGNSSYSIEPLAASTTAEHLLLQRGEMVPGMVMYQMPNGGGQFPGPGTATGEFRPRRHTRYLELLVVVDKEGFDAFGRSITNVTLEVIEIINLVDGLFYSFRLRVLLTALEVWVKNPVRVTKNLTEVLHNFNLWREQQGLTYAMHDVGCLFASMDFSHGTRALHRSGKSNFASACDRKRASAVISFAKQPYMDTAVHVARVLGYVLGMEHDDSSCRCGNTSKCIMSPHSIANYQFSNCSKKHYFDFITLGKGFCLNNAPEPVMSFARQRCRSGALKFGVKCNCGSEAQCKLDPCCENTCKKKKGAICTSGGCCKNCKPLPEGEVCRESAGPCDLPEYCNGTSEHCPADVAKQDGTVCAEDGYCYSGKCQSRTLQCMSIFGKEAKPAPLPCFQEVNMKGDRFGNCWGDGADINFQKCELENIQCGRLQCTNVRHLPQLEDHTTIIQTPVGDIWCWGTDYHLGVNILDAGVIKDGMQCGEKKICINRTCVPEEKYFASHCSANRTCRGKGVCNTRGNCHCDNGWAPPNCQFIGFGGSVDSGPAPVTKKGLFRFVFRITVITVAVLVFAALVILHMRKLRVTQALNRLVGCFGAREQAPEENAEVQVEGDGSKPTESQNSPV